MTPELWAKINRLKEIVSHISGNDGASPREKHLAALLQGLLDAVEAAETFAKSSAAFMSADIEADEWENCRAEFEVAFYAAIEKLGGEK